MTDLKYPTIKDLRWRVDVSISTSAMARTMSPLVVCPFFLSFPLPLFIIFKPTNSHHFRSLSMTVRKR